MATSYPQFSTPPQSKSTGKAFLAEWDLIALRFIARHAAGLSVVDCCTRGNEVMPYVIAAREAGLLSPPAFAVTVACGGAR